MLVGFAESMAAIETCWSLQTAGFAVFAFQRRGARAAIRRSKRVPLYEVSAPEQDATATRADLTKLIARIQPSAMLPIDDAALWLAARIDTGDTELAAASAEAAETALDKSAQIRLAESVGLAVPPTDVVETLSAVDPLQWPVIVKPARALYESGGRLIRPTGVVYASPAELKRDADRRMPGPLLVQPLLRGAGEGLFGHASRSGIVGWSSHRRVRMVNPQGSASSACESMPIDQKLLEPATGFLNALDWRGLFMLEFLREENGQPWFMELNGRAWGSMALARRRGYEYPAWTVQSILDPTVVPTIPSDPPNVRCRNLGLELAHLAFVLRGPKSEALDCWPRPLATVRALATISRRDRLYNWNRVEPMILVADTVQSLAYFASRWRKSR